MTVKEAQGIMTDCRSRFQIETRDHLKRYRIVASGQIIVTSRQKTESSRFDE